jgi:hypothetical protein
MAAFVFNSGNPLHTNSYLQTSGRSSFEFSAQYIIPRDGTLQNYYVMLSNDSGGEGQFYNVDLRINGVDTGFTSALYAPDRSHVDTTTTLNVSAGDRISIYFGRTSAAAQVTVQASISISFEV